MAFGRILGGLWTVLGVKDETKKPIDNVRKNFKGAAQDTDKFGDKLRGITRESRQTVTSLNNIASALDFSRLAATKTFQLNKQMEVLTIQAGTGAKATSEMQDAVLGLSNRTGLATDETAKLVTALTATGQSISDLDPQLKGAKDQFGAISDGAAVNTERLMEMVGRFGVSASAAVEFAASSRNLGTSIVELTDKATQWQKQFRMPGMLSALPRVISFAQKSIDQFGRSVTGDAKQIIESTLKIGAVYAKTYGVDMPTAIQKAQQNQDFFMSSLRSSEDVFLGLEDNFDALHNALFESGIGFKKTQELIKLGAKDPVAYAANLFKLEEQLKMTRGAKYAERFHRQMVKNSSEVVRGYLQNKKSLEEAQAAQIAAEKYNASAAGKAEATFGSMVSSLKDVGSTAMETFRNLLQLGKQILGMTFAKDIGDTFKGLSDKLRGFNKTIKETAQRFHDSEKYKKLKPILQGVGKVLIMVGAAASTAAGAFATGLMPLQTATGLFGKIPIVGKGVSGFFGGILGFAKKLIWPIATVKALGTALNDIGVALRDPSLSSSDKAMAVLRGAFVGLADFVDDLFLGLPGKILGFFFPKMKGGLAQGTKALFNSWQRDLKKAGLGTFHAMFKAIESWVIQKLVGFRAYVFANFKNWQKSAKEVGRNVGRALGYLTTVAINIITEVFSLSFWKRQWRGVVTYFETGGGQQMKDAFGDIFYSMLNIVGDFSESMVDEFMHAFGATSDDLEDFWEDTKEIFIGGWDYLTRSFERFGYWLYGKILAIPMWWIEMWGGLKATTIEFLGENKKFWAAFGIGLLRVFTEVGKGIVKKLTSPLQALTRVAKKLGLIQEDFWDKIDKAGQDVHDTYLEFLNETVAETDAATKLMVEQSHAATNESLKDKRRMLNAYNEFVLAAIEEQEQADQKAANKRLERRMAERESMKLMRIEKEKARKLEDERQAAALKVEKAASAARDIASDQLSELIEALEKAKERAEERGDTRIAKNIEAALKSETKYLEAIQDAKTAADIVMIFELARQAAGPGFAKKYLGKAAISTDKAQQTPPAKTESLGKAAISPDKAQQTPPAKTERAPAPMKAAIGAGTVPKPVEKTDARAEPTQLRGSVNMNVRFNGGAFGKLLEFEQGESFVESVRK